MYRPRSISLKPLLLAALWSMGCVSLNGCIEFYSYHPVRASVQDAETGVPIPGARVGVSYLYVLVLNAPSPSSALTDANGVAVLRTANFEAREWNASADGYLPHDEMEHDHPPRREETFRLYRQPAPRLSVIVPNGYHGPLKLDLRPVLQWVQGEVGKREFTYRMSPTGYVGIDATPLLLRMDTFKINAAFEDGTPIPPADSRVGPNDTALRFVDISDSGRRTLFVIGTERDEQAIHNLTTNDEAFDALFVEPPSQPSPATRP